MPPRRRDRDDRACIYLRQSTFREESVSLEQQETACRDYCRRRGYSVVAIVSDPGLSGRKWDKRPGVQRAMRMVDDHDADVLVLWKWSRISRRRLDFEIAMDRAETAGGRIESATEPLDVTTASGKFSRGMLAEVAAFESARIGEDWRATHSRRRNAGVPAQGGERYGYLRLLGATGKGVGYEVDPATASTLSWMYQRVIEGRGAAWIAGELNRQGIENPRGNPWAQQAVYPLLDSGFAAGLISHQPRDSNNKPRGEREYFDAAHEPIISTATWEAYRAVRRRAVNTAPRVIEARYPLSGLTRCADCGSAMWPMTARGREAGYILICGRYKQSKQGRCVTITRARAEEAVKEWLRGYVTEVEQAARADAAAKAALERSRRDEQSARRQVTNIEEKLSRLNRAWLDGTVPDAGYSATRDGLLDELKQAQSEIQIAEDARVVRRSVSPGEAQTLIDEWDELPAADTRNTLRNIIDHIVITPPPLGPDGRPTRPYGRASVTVVPVFAD